MKKRGLYIGISFLILLLLVLPCIFVAFGNAAVFWDKSGNLSIPAILFLSVCVFFAVCDVVLFLFTKEGKLNFKQSFEPKGTILVYLTATVLITALVSYFSIFCINTLANNAHTPNRQSIVDMISKP